MDTQVRLLTSSKVISVALSDNRISTLERVRKAEDPEVNLANALSATVLPKYLADRGVGMTSPNPVEAAAIVNAVITKSYLDSSRRNLPGSRRKASMERLVKYQSELEEEEGPEGGEDQGAAGQGQRQRGDAGSAPGSGGEKGGRRRRPRPRPPGRSPRRVTVEEYESRRRLILDTEMKILNGGTELEAPGPRSPPSAAHGQGPGPG